MKYITVITLLSFFLTACSRKDSPVLPGTADSATVTIINGYGTGRYKTGDTVNIWSEAIPDGNIFGSWTGYTNLLENAGEWHNRFVMPAGDVTVTAALQTASPFTLNYEKIKGMNILKKVYYYFPAGHKGIVYLLHGTGGSARNLVTNFEWNTMIRDLVASGYAIIITEAEEASLNTDLNGDGYIRWHQTPVDTLTNPDYANFRALTDTFYHRGYTSPAIPLYSIGMSDGGAFSAALSFIYHFRAGISYCAPTSAAVTSSSVTPFQFCMAGFDSNPSVGAAGNAAALQNSEALTGRGICSQYYLHDRSPVYPQRFARWSSISASLSLSLYNELKANHWLDAKNYLTASSGAISTDILANPSAWPVASSLTSIQLQYLAGQLDDMYGDHQFYSDLDKTTIHFLDAPCQ